MEMRNREEDLIVEGTEFKTDRNIKVGKFFCYINGKTYSTIRGLLNNIRPLTVKEYFDAEYKRDDEGICYCGKETKFNNLFIGYKKYCSSECHTKSEEFRKFISERFVGNPEKVALFKSRYLQTMHEKPEFERLEINARRIATNKLRYGDNYQRERTKRQWLNRTPEEKRAVHDKINLTKIKNGTIDSGSTNFCHKRMIIDNKEFMFQGYEGIVIEMLVNNFGFHVDDILTGKDCPRIEFIGNLSQFHRPDIFIPSINLYVEVKSSWTYWGRPDFYEANLEKQKAAIKAKHNHIIFIISPVLTEKDISDFGEFLSMIISSQALETEKVQRLSCDWEYRSIAIGSGSAKHPKWMVI